MSRASEERAGPGSFTLAVQNIEKQIAHLDKLEIITAARTSVQTVNTLMITDLDGKHIAFAEALDPSMAH